MPRLTSGSLAFEGDENALQEGLELRVVGMKVNRDERERFTRYQRGVLLSNPLHFGRQLCE